MTKKQIAQINQKKYKKEHKYYNIYQVIIWDENNKIVDRKKYKLFDGQDINDVVSDLKKAFDDLKLDVKFRFEVKMLKMHIYL